MQRVGGGRVSVSDLTPAGAEPHDLELTPKQIDTILDADVAFVMGRGFQPAVEAAARNRDAATVTLLDRVRSRRTCRRHEVSTPAIRTCGSIRCSCARSCGRCRPR